MIATHATHIARYSDAGSQPHHTVIEQVERNSDLNAVDAVWAGVHADLPPVACAYIVVDDTDGDYGLVLVDEDGQTIDTEWWLGGVDTAAQRAVQRLTALA